LITAAGRFQQIVTLFELAEQEGKEAVRKILAANAPVLTESIISLLRTPYLRWEVDSDGRNSGRFIDLPLEERIIHIGRMAHAFDSKPLRALFESEVLGLAVRYPKGGFDMGYATSVVKAFDEFPQLRANGGAALQRELLDSILHDEDSWWAEQLNSLIDCSKAVSIWTAADDAKLDNALSEYENKGVSDEFDNCNNRHDYDRLRDDLTTLGEKTGVPFPRDIQRIEERLADLEPRYDEEGGGGWSPRSTGATPDGRGDTEEAIREVFGTLLD
jgi:hypothetical protein